MSSNEQARSNGNGNGEGIPDDLRCKRSDGKQWRCTAMSMPDKTVCEKHYIQAKKRAANSAFRANQKKAKRVSSSFGETDTYSEEKMDDYGVHMSSVERYSNGLASASKNNGIREERHSKGLMQYSPESPMMRDCYGRVAVDLNDDLTRDDRMFEENYKSYRTPSSVAALMETSRNRSHQSLSPMEYSAASTDASAESLGEICHQCQRKDRDRMIICLKCNQRAFCDSCVSTQYSDLSVEEVEKVCPVCRGLCNCKLCLRSDNTMKVRVREIPVLDKLRYLYRLLSAILPVIKQIHLDQCTEVELEKRLRGAEIDLVRARLKSDEQMCCNVCRIPVVDYYRHCSNCSYDLCLRCCQDLREESSVDISGTSQILSDIKGVPKRKLNFSYRFPEWEANGDGSIPCPPKEYGGCGSRSLNLARIFKMNWVAKLVKNAEEMVNGCKVSDLGDAELCDSRFCKLAEREESSDNFVYSPSLETIESDGVAHFEKQWADGRPVIVKKVLDESSSSRWDPETIWRDIDEMSDEKLKEHDPFLKAINCLDGSELEVKLGEFIKAYGDGRNRETGEPLLWKLKDWPSSSASEEFIFYQRPEFIRRFPFLEYIHPRLGLLNVAAKLPHYSIQNDASPRIYVSCGTCQEPDTGDSLTNIHYNMRDMVYLLVHTPEGTTLETARETKPGPGELDQKISENESLPSPEKIINDGELHDLSQGRGDTEKNESEMMLTVNPEIITDELHDLSRGKVDTEKNETEMMLTVNPEIITDELHDLSQGKVDTEKSETETVLPVNPEIITDELHDLSHGKVDTEKSETETVLPVNPEIITDELHDISLGRVEAEKNESEMIMAVNPEIIADHSHKMESSCTSSCAIGARWDIFRRQDIPKLAEYLQRTFQKRDNVYTDFVSRPLYEGLFLNEHYKRQLKDEFGVEPWTFEQHLGEAVFIPAGCPFQFRNLQSNVQVALDFLCPASVGEAARLAEEIRCLPNDHDAKLQFLEIGKISLYAASSAIKEVQRLVLDPKFGAELGFEDHNLTKAVSHNLDKAIKRPQQISCA